MAGYLHDVGNMLTREAHAQTGRRPGVPGAEGSGGRRTTWCAIMAAIANHEEDRGHTPSRPISAAVILADKSDVHRSRVRRSGQVDHRHPRSRQLCRRTIVPTGRLGCPDRHPRADDRHGDQPGHGVLRDLPGQDADVPPRRRAAGCAVPPRRSTGRSWHEANPLALGFDRRGRAPGRRRRSIGFATGALKPTLGLDLEGGVSVILQAPDGTAGRRHAAGAREHPQPGRRVRRRRAADRRVRAATSRSRSPAWRTARVEQRAKTQYCLIGARRRELRMRDDPGARRSAPRRTASPVSATGRTGAASASDRPDGSRTSASRPQTAAKPRIEGLSVAHGIDRSARARPARPVPRVASGQVVREGRRPGASATAASTPRTQAQRREGRRRPVDPATAQFCSEPGAGATNLPVRLHRQGRRRRRRSTRITVDVRSTRSTAC